MQPSSCPKEDGANGSSEKIAPDENTAAKATLDFLWRVHASISNDIRLADTKAVMSIGFCSALISGLFAAKAPRFLRTGLTLTDIGVYETVMGTGVTLALLMLVSAVLSSVWAFIPRLWDKRLPSRWQRIKHLFWRTPSSTCGFLYWEQIRAHQTPQAFYARVARLSETELVEKLAEHLFVLSCVSTDKYASLTRSVLLAVPGGLLAAVVTLLAYYRN